MKVKGYRILVKPDDIKTTSDGGIVLVLDERMEQASQQFGTVIDIGPTCWTNAEGEKLEQWCAVGDRILFSKHAGRFVYDPDDNDEEYMIILDTDVIATL
jgi:co-chaperonin GroES (HSP10)